MQLDMPNIGPAQWESDVINFTDIIKVYTDIIKVYTFFLPSIVLVHNINGLSAHVSPCLQHSRSSNPEYDAKQHTNCDAAIAKPS